MRESKTLEERVPRLSSKISAVVYVGVLLVSYILVATALSMAISSITANVREPTYHSHYLKDASKAFNQLAVFFFFFPVVISVLISAFVDRQDRLLALKRCLWLWLPPAALAGLLYFLRVGYWAISLTQFYVGIALFFLIAMFWSQVSNPVLRKWANQRAHDVDRFELVERVLWFPLQPHEIGEVEIAVPQDKYFSLLAGLSAMVFLLLETILGEFVSNSIGAAGYVGTSIIALFVAALAYPAHSWASARIEIGKTKSVSEQSLSAQPYWQEIAVKSGHFYKLVFVRYWYLTALAAIVSAIGGLLLSRHIS